MKRSATILLQAVTVLIGVAALAFLVWEPTAEGRNANATLFEIYFKDPFLAYAYVASIPFFVALYQGFKVLGWLGQGRGYSPEAAKALRIMKLCAGAIVAFVIGGEVILLPNAGEDRPPALFMGLLVTLGAILIATMAMVTDRVWRRR